MMNLWIQHLEIKNGGTKMADHKFNLNVNLGEILYLWVPDNTDYILEFITP